MFNKIKIKENSISKYKIMDNCLILTSFLSGVGIFFK